MKNKKYTVELTFKEWMEVTHALGFAAQEYKSKDMNGQANKFKAIKEEIAKGIAHE